MILLAMLQSIVEDSGLPQVELARRSGLSTKHVNQMLRHGVGTVKAWEKLLTAVGVVSLEVGTWSP
jgi:Winged helix-turn-helix DNA-binding